MTVNDVLDKIRIAENVYSHLNKDNPRCNTEAQLIDILEDYAEMLRNMKVRDI